MWAITSSASRSISTISTQQTSRHRPRPACPTGSSAPVPAIPVRAASTPMRAINIGAPCPSTTTGNAQGTCYNTGGITFNMPLWSSGYNALQTQLTRNAGKNTSVGVVYTYSHAIDYEDNGAGSGRAAQHSITRRFTASTVVLRVLTRSTTLQIWGRYSLPFGPGQMWLKTTGVDRRHHRRMAVERAIQPLQRLPVLQSTQTATPLAGTRPALAPLTPKSAVLISNWAATHRHPVLLCLAASRG